MRDEGVETVAMEVSSHALDQHRIDATNFAATCFTNLSHDHLDYHESVDVYFEAKARLFTPVFHASRRDQCRRRLRRAARPTSRDERPRRVALRRSTIPRLTSPRVASSFRPRAPGSISSRAARTPCGPHVAGRYVQRCERAGAAATALLAGFELDAIVAGLEQPTIVPGRMERIDTGQDFTVLVDYAHTPAALDAALGAARELVGPGGQLIAVFGCGGDRDRTKRPLMGDIAARSADRVYVTTDNRGPRNRQRSSTRSWPACRAEAASPASSTVVPRFGMPDSRSTG